LRAAGDDGNAVPKIDLVGHVVPRWLRFRSGYPKKMARPSASQLTSAHSVGTPSCAEALI